MKTVAEEWRPVKGYEGFYEVSNNGNIRSIDRVVTKRGHAHCLTGKMKKQTEDRYGYLHVWLCRDRTERKHFVHRLVCEAFVGSLDGGLEVNHIDCNKKNNCACNLEPSTSLANSRHAVANRIHAHGERCGGAKLRQVDVDAIRRELANRAGCSELAARFGVTRFTIWDIATGRSWNLNNTRRRREPALNP